MGELLSSTKSTLKTFRYGDLVEGRVISMSRSQAFVDLGAKSEGIIGGRKGVREREYEDVSTLTVGDRVLAKVLQSENDQGYIVLSLKKAATESAWRQVLLAEESGGVLPVTVTDSNRGGLVVEYEGLSGFIPFSHLQDLTSSPSETSLPSSLLRQTLKVKVIETDRASNRIVFSQKLAAFSADSELKNFLKRIARQKKVKGKVVSLLPFGAMVKIADRVEGLLHVSELSWARVDHPEEVLKVGDNVEVAVLGFDESQGRLSLSMKALSNNPWDGIAKQYQVGQKLRGTITKVVPFGAFLKLAEGVEGLIHVSETIGPLEVGEKVEAVIINLEPKKRRLGLSVKKLKVKN